ncbi:putative ammonium transporter 2 [Thrips palmi]|uniref:Ammonium transporter n=1 Tax=Thrips palmi TaxID=161013 RepID=A0A6P8YJZ2_THRPL|nr:putative ammonium transporter 2 [Thrips palmi]
MEDTADPGAASVQRANQTRLQPAIPGIYNLTQEDSNWMVTSAFIIFTMQTGFGLLESGCVSQKNEINIMMKNLVDIFLGGFTYWLFGFATSFGHSTLRNPFIGWGDFALDSEDSDPNMGALFTVFLFQMSFATTATTIVSGAMAERCNFKAYCVFSFLNTIVYCIPAGWVWSETGFLNEMGVVDIAGSGPVHLVGGMSALASAIMLGPRLGRYDLGNQPMPLGTPVNAVMGLFVLWWGWLAFNSGSTLGVSGAKWHYSAKAAVMTLLASFGGGFMGLGYTLVRNAGNVEVIDLINGVLGALVSVTAGCFLYTSWEALLIGFIGAGITCSTMPLFDWLHVDDPVGATSVHGMAGMWGVLSVGLFASAPPDMPATQGRSGVAHGGGFYLLGVQTLSVLCLSGWSFASTMVLLWLIDKVVPIRLGPHEELIGADLVEHRVKHEGVGVNEALAILADHFDSALLSQIRSIGTNPGHEAYLATHFKPAKLARQRDNKDNNVAVLMRALSGDDKQYAWVD